MASSRSLKKPGSSSYAFDSMNMAAQEFLNTIGNINESTTSDFLNNPMKALRNPATEATLRKAFMENSYDEEDYLLKNTYALKEFKQERNDMFENAFDMLQETAASATNRINPILKITSLK